MQRYRPDIAWPLNGKPWPIMAEDSIEGTYYARDEVLALLRRIHITSIVPDELMADIEHLLGLSGHPRAEGLGAE